MGRYLNWKEEGLFSELGSLLLITGQQTASQGHEQCVVAEQRAFSLEPVRLSAREWGEERERKRERETVCCGHWLPQRAWAPCQLRLWALIKKENLYPASGHGSVGLTGASSWSLPAHTSWDSSLHTTEWEELGRCPAAFTGVCHLPVNCQVLCPFHWRPKQQHGLNQWQPREVNNGQWTSSLGKGPLSA